MQQIVLPQPKDRNLFLSSQVDQASINEITKSIVEISQHDLYLKEIYDVNNLLYSPTPIKLYIDSYGGNVYQCFGLLGVMGASTTPIYTIVTGCAMSAGFMIAICGHKRYGYKNSTFLYHQVSTGTYGTLKSIQEDVVETKRLQSILEKIVLEKTDIKKKRLKEVFKTKHDWFISAKEAVEYKIIEEIL